jgi:hypothetical protein
VETKIKALTNETQKADYLIVYKEYKALQEKETTKDNMGQLKQEHADMKKKMASRKSLMGIMHESKCSIMMKGMKSGGKGSGKPSKKNISKQKNKYKS